MFFRSLWSFRLTSRYYIWGNGLIAQVEANGTTHYIHADEQGSTIALTDASGSVTDQIAYSPYGEIFNRTGTTDIPYLYVGGFGVFNEGHNLLHMKARYYDAQLKRFLTKDPIGLDGGSNLYAYAANNPLFFFDPFGLDVNQSGGSSLESITNFVIEHGFAGVTFNAGAGPGVSVSLTVTESGVHLFGGVGLGVGIGASATAGLKAGGISGFTVKVSGSGGTGNFGGSVGGGVSKGGGVISAGGGLGVGAGGSITGGFTGTLISFERDD